MVTSLLAAAVLAPSPLSRLPQPVEDTYLNVAMPDVNYGRERTLHGGPGLAILVRFPQLDYTDIRGQTLTGGSLVLTLEGDQDVRLRSVSRVRVPWNEGAGRQGLLATDAATGSAPRGGATWGQRMSAAGTVRWGSGGASAPTDATLIEGAIGVREGGNFVIGGLTDSLLAILQDPSQNYGFRLEFTGPVAFRSGESMTDAPRLNLSFEPRIETTEAKPDLTVASVTTGAITAERWPDDGQSVEWTARVTNHGSAPSDATTLTWRVADGAPVSVALAPVPDGESRDVSFSVPWRSDQHDRRWSPLSVRVTPSSRETELADNVLTVPMDGLAVGLSIAPSDRQALGTGSDAVINRAFAELNHRILAHSRFLAAPQGVVERFRFAADGTAHMRITLEPGALRDAGSPAALHAVLVTILSRGVAELPRGLAATPPAVEVRGLRLNAAPTALTGVGELPDTRDDGLWPVALPLPELGFFNPQADLVPMPARGYLSRTEAAALNASVGALGEGRRFPLGAVPSSAFLRAFYPDGQPIEGATLEVFQWDGEALSGEPVFTAKTSRQGAVFLSGRPAEGASPNPLGTIGPGARAAWLAVRAEAFGEVDLAWLPGWRLFDEWFRGNTGAAPLRMEVMLPSGPVNRTRDLAVNQLVSDAAGRFPAELHAVVDGQDATRLRLDPAKDAWIEIDLGRDRLLGEVEIVFAGAVPEAYDLMAYRTGQDAGAAQAWYREVDGPLQAARRGVTTDGTTRIAYRNQAMRARYLRLVPRSSAEFELAGIRVFPLQAPEGGDGG